jgi:hypothetical protein
MEERNDKSGGKSRKGINFYWIYGLIAVVMLSMLGPRSSLTDMSGSTGSSQSQHRQPSAVPTSSSRVTVSLPCLLNVPLMPEPAGDARAHL